MSLETLITVDIGNGSAKLGAFDAWRLGEFGAPSWTARVATKEIGVEECMPRLPESSCRWSVVSVHREGQRRLAEWVKANRPEDQYRELDHRHLPIEVGLEFPGKVGADRLAAAVGANAWREASRPAVVVDSGTAMTVDWLSAEGVFLGGAILPGVLMQARSLSQETDLLPFVDPAWRDDPPSPVGDSTMAAIRSGLYWGAVGAIRELLAQMYFSHGAGQSPQLFLTGGDAPLLAPQFGEAAIAREHLVLEGIVLATRQLVA